MNLKQIIGLLIAGSTLAAPVTNRSGEQLSISISTPNSVVRIGSPVRVDILAKNMSDHSIRVSKTVAENRAELDFQVIVNKRNDGDPEETRWGRKVHGKDPEDAHSGMSIVSGDLPPEGS